MADTLHESFDSILGSVTRYVGIHDDGDMVLLSDVREAFASRPAEVDDWISVEHRMPEPGQQVIAYRPTAELTSDSMVRIVRYLGAGRERESWQGVWHGFDCICHPTHWKPIPGSPSHTTNKEK